MSKQPEALELADWLSNSDSFPTRQMYRAAAELRRLHAVNADLLEALQDLRNNVTEAMKTGGWVPTPLHESFWEAMLGATTAIEKATGEA